MSDIIPYIVTDDNGIERKFKALNKDTLKALKKNFNKRVAGHKSTKELLEEMGMINPHIKMP